MAITAGNPFPSSSEPASGGASADPMNSPPGSSGGMPDTSAGSLGGTSGMGSGPRATVADNEMLSRVVRRAHETVDRLAESAAPHVQRLQDSMSSTGEMLGSRTDQLRETGDEWAESLRCTVRDNPLAAVATAVAVGVLLARLTS